MTGEKFLPFFSDTYGALTFFATLFVSLGWGFRAGTSFLIGSGFMFLVFYSTAWILLRLFTKKKKTWLLFIPLKYPLVFLLLVFLYKHKSIAPLFLTLGFLLLPFAFLAQAVRQAL